MAGVTEFEMPYDVVLLPGDPLIEKYFPPLDKRSYEPDEHLARRHLPGQHDQQKHASGKATHEQLELFPAPGIKVGGQEVPIVDADFVSPSTFDKMHDADVDEVEAEALKRYTGNEHLRVNSYLRNGYDDYGGETDIDADVDNMRSAIAKNTVKTDVMVTRRVNYDAFGIYEDEYDDLDISQEMRGLEGSVIQDDGFLSTTIKAKPKPSTHYVDYPVEMRIRVPKGTNGVFLDTEDITNFPSEKELLLGDGTKLAVLRAGREGAVWILDAQVVP